MTSNFTFVRQLYQTVLARDPDSTGTTYWTDQLDTGFATRAGVAYNFFSLPEYKTEVEPLARLYYATFGRVPDVPGLQFWVGVIRTGASTDQIATQFIQSPEFKTLFGQPANNGALVDILFQNILKRPADAAGRAFWVTALDQGMASGAVLNGIAQSAEFQTRANLLVEDAIAYYGIVGREATAAELAAVPADLTRIVIEAVNRSGGSTGLNGLSYDTTTITESLLNDGTIAGAISISLSGDTFKGNIGASLGKLSNTPSGLTGSITKTTDTIATLTFSGAAKANAAVNSISNLGVTFSAADFVSASTLGKTGVVQAIKLNFIDMVAEEINGSLTLTGTSTSSVKFDLDADKLYFGTSVSALTAGSMSNVKYVDASGLTGSKITVSFIGDSADNVYLAADVGGTITGGAGTDLLVAGNALDRFVFSDTATNNGIDTLYKFKVGAGGDVLDFSAFLNKTGSTHLAAVAAGSAAAAPWANGDVLVLTGSGLDTPAAVAARFNAGDYAAATAAGKAVVITADIIGDAKIWYLVNQTPVATIADSELTLVGILSGINNLGLTGYGLTSANVA